MKAVKLVKQIEKLIEKYGEDIDVFIDSPGFNSEDTFSTTDHVGEYVLVENLSEYPPHLIFEEHGDDRGLVFCVVLIGDEHISHSG